MPPFRLPSWIPIRDKVASNIELSLGKSSEIISYRSYLMAQFDRFDPPGADSIHPVQCAADVSRNRTRAVAVTRMIGGKNDCLFKVGCHQCTVERYRERFLSNPTLTERFGYRSCSRGTVNLG